MENIRGEYRGNAEKIFNQVKHTNVLNKQFDQNWGFQSLMESQLWGPKKSLINVSDKKNLKSIFRKKKVSNFEIVLKIIFSDLTAFFVTLFIALAKVYFKKCFC